MLTTLLSAFGLVVVIVMVGALFPAVGHSIGKLNLPKGVATLLGGADYGTLTGWMRSEIGAVYGPLVVAYAGISVAASSTAGDEEAGILALTLAYPLERTRWVLAKATAVMITIALVSLALFVGLLVGVAVGGGGIAFANMAALALHLAFFGGVIGAVALALAAATGRRALASAGAASFAVFGFFVNGFAPLVHAVDWLKYLSIFHYYDGDDPLTNGVDAGQLAVLATTTIVLVALAVVGMRRRDLRR